MAAPPDDELDEAEVAPAAADEALELALDASLLALDKAELAALEPLARTELAVELAPEARDEALPPATFEKMVVEPTVVEKVEEPEVSTEMRAEVVMADEEPPEPAEAVAEDPVPVVSVEVTVPVGLVTRVVAVEVAVPDPALPVEEQGPG